ncbi:MAG: MarR family transcriptional regulator [Lentilactobacillus hilgardii]|uniref:MarR family winged helix-turn-helix transcriptional regulator n=1 Tax=Lentilactobacillus hilgardii TaxID=1588 RepID=UPI001CC1D023|nr:MarR family transcriptional regulator [Lentilactobacillus hilgardii]MBZ2201580.1 MarR family transcriptional regulator [Lentilactobacillus hilgardii]MBZ2204498.1 MarR family transcriptional regulator [Lentilactobacillus hilgardii]
MAADRQLLKQIIILNRGIRRTERRIIRKHARQNGLSPNQLLLIDTLEDFPNNSVMGLAEILELNKSTISTLVSQLLEQRLISKQLDPQNKSRFILNDTSKGKHVAAGIYDNYLDELIQTFRLDQLDLAGIKHVLEKMESNH